MALDKFDFSGWVTKNDLRCSDGRTIRKDAFALQHGATVPLVWNHNHKDADNVLGHVVLENREEGVYGYGSFNNTEQGLNAKMLVQHGDITSMSIFANQLKEQAGNVLHGVIREVSLVLAGANPGASIEWVELAHGDESESSAVISYMEDIDNNAIEHTVTNSEEPAEKEKEPEPKDETSEKEEIPEDNPSEKEEIPEDKPAPAKKQSKSKSKSEVKHADEFDDETVEDFLNNMSEKKIEIVDRLIDAAVKDESVEEAIASEFEKFTEDEKNVTYFLVTQAVSQNGQAKHSDENDDPEGGEEDMPTITHNVFENDAVETAENTLTHAEMMEIIKDAERFGSMKESALQHGIEDVEYLFPEAQNVRNTPDWVKRDDSWVSIVLNGFHHSPFSRIKSMYADITEADARAKGYIKGNQKFDEVFPLFKRVTTPQTIYKKQTMDRDDLIDITSFDVINWLKAEMRGMLEEEIARAAIVGDGRSAASDDKINPINIRPIWTDDDVYTIKSLVELTSDDDDNSRAKKFIRACIKSRKFYKGSGNPTMLMTEDMLTDCLLIEDLNGRVIYDTEEKLRTALRVSRIITVPVMENLTREVSGVTHYLDAIYLNLSDYTIGADKGGAVSMFEDFDIDYNKEKYLIETRCSGALTKPYSACAIEHSFQ